MSGEHLSQWQLVRKRFVKHRMAQISLFVIICLYLIALFAGFLAPYRADSNDTNRVFASPMPVRASFEHGIHTYGFTDARDKLTYRRIYKDNPADVIPLGFFVRGDDYKLFGLFPTRTHFFGVDLDEYASLNPDKKLIPWTFSAEESEAYKEEHPTAEAYPRFYLLGGDSGGRDVFSRLIISTRISLFIGLVGIVITFILGMIVGGISGYIGGHTDNAIQRAIEVLNSVPREPMLLAMAAIMPKEWTSVAIFFCITILLALLSWTGLARVVRGKVLSLREEDYCTAARLLGASHGRVIGVHLLPGITSHAIVVLTLAIPAMILGETALSFLNLGIKEPAVSWGVMITDAKEMTVVENYPWILSPLVFLIFTVLSFNFLGDGLRDAADPYAAK